ncbi:ATP-binding protein [Bacteroides faecis]|nr:ATP-binding protein [Bacteroides faecis]
MDRIMELLSKLRFYGMLETYRNDCRTTSSDGMTNDEFLKWLLESEYDYRRNVSIERLIRSANFRYKAYMEKIDYTIKRNLDRNQLERLASLDFIRDGQNIFITGSSGTGKSYIASAIGYEACKMESGPYTLMRQSLWDSLNLPKTRGLLTQR